MASWGGHTLPGTFFIIFGIYYAFLYISRYLKSRSKKDYNYYGTFYCCGKLPCSMLVVEGCLKIFFTSVGTLVELFYPGAPMGALHNSDGDFTHPMNWQHATMYFFFGLSGLADIISYTAKNVVPKGLDRIMGGLALFVEGYLFFFHLHGRSMIDTRCHVLLVIAVWPCALFALLEAFLINNRAVLHLLEMFHSILLIFQGVWFWMVAYILYPPSGERWDPCFTEAKMDAHQLAELKEHQHNSSGEEKTCNEGKVHLNVMFITMFWSWALAFVSIGVGIIYFLVYKWLKMRRQLDRSFCISEERTALKMESRHKGLLDGEDEDEEAF
ncbi:transmembrane protein 45B-like isoform X1 [Styela clava]|uniref:transmembrane protein 45B-like isoform X2 n=1 Tax=Styela clava TaxID=7725 RepID=UPI00193A8501|nr:transmembrane protein 45B-like isoform X2 [Styela clava]